MKKNMKEIITSLLFIAMTSILQAQDVVEFETPKAVDEEVKEVLIPSKIFISAKIDSKILANLIKKSTPEEQKSTIGSDVRDLAVNFKIGDSIITFEKHKINQIVSLKKGEGLYKIRNKTNRSWPFQGYKYGNWKEVSCQEIGGKAKSIISIVLDKDFVFKANVNFTADADKLKCLDSDLAPLATLFSWNEYEKTFKNKFENELAKINFKDSIVDIWNKIQEPIKIDNDIILSQVPEKLNHKDFFFENNFGKYVIGLVFNVSDNGSAVAVDSGKLKKFPELEKNTEKPRFNYNINYPISYSFVELQKIIDDAFTGKYIKGKNAAGKERKYGKITAVTVFGSTESEYDMVIGMNTKFFKNPQLKEDNYPIYLHAKIAYDTIKSSLYISKYKLDTKSKSALQKNNLNPIVGKASYSKITSKFKIKVGDLSDKKKIITKKLRKNKIPICELVNLESVASSVELNQVIPQPDRLFCLFVLRGNATSGEFDFGLVSKK